MKSKYILSAILVTLFTAACTDTYNVPQPLVVTEQASYVLETPDAGTLTLTFQSNMPWHIEVTPANARSEVQDIKVQPSSGQASVRPIQVEVSFGANPDLKREAVISILTTATGAAVRLVQPGPNDPHIIKGALETPYAPDDLVTDLMGGESISGSIYVRGIVSKVKEISAKIGDTGYGNVTFWLTDSGEHPEDDKQAFQVYRAKDFGMADVTNENLLKEGDVVTIYGPVVVYKGDTPETSQNAAQVIAVNGLGTANGSGEEESPYNIGAAMAAAATAGATPTADVYVKGVVSKLQEVEDGSEAAPAFYWISDDGWHPDSDTSVLKVPADASLLSVGMEVLVKGKLTGGDAPSLSADTQLIKINGLDPPAPEE